MTEIFKDPIITPFIQQHLKEGYQIKLTKTGSSYHQNCPKCQCAYLYTFIKGLFSIKKCPFCSFSQAEW